MSQTQEEKEGKKRKSSLIAAPPQRLSTFSIAFKFLSISKSQESIGTAGNGAGERGNGGGRVERVRFLRCKGNFVLLLIDLSPFEILLTIKLTVCCAVSTVLHTRLVLVLSEQTAYVPASRVYLLPQTDASKLHKKSRCHRQTETSME